MLKFLLRSYGSEVINATALDISNKQRLHVSFQTEGHFEILLKNMG
jgi:hypothetical protein